jgi:nicotinamide-nucleotide amidase
VDLPGRSGAAVPVYAFPGVPRELKALWHEHVRERVVSQAVGAAKIVRRLYRVFGLGESHIDHRLAGLVDGVAGATLHYQVAFPETLVKLVVEDADAAAAAARLAAGHDELLARLGEHVYSFDGPGGHAGDSLAAALGRALAATGATLAVAESCTGGMVGSLVTDVAGSSAWFRGGVLAYANDLKESLLGVRRETLVAHGAVSAECVAEMAAGARARAGATWGVAVSGVAGPGGGTAEKPVGTVHIAVVGPNGPAAHKRLDYPGSRDQVRRLSAYWAMALVLGAARRVG